MKNEILNSLDNPVQLEKLYRSNKGQFKRTFNSLYPDLKDHSMAGFWYERLNYESEEINWGSRHESLFVIIASIIAGIIAKFPAIFELNEDFFYPRNIGFIIFPALTTFFAWKNNFTTGKIAFVALSTLAAVLFINFLPVNESDTLFLSCIHLLVFLWLILGFAYAGKQQHNDESRLHFLQYNGDLLVISALIVISGIIMTGITIGLFSLIGFNIEEFYFNNIVVFALPAVPIFGTFLIQSNPQLVGRVSPVIAKIFSPLVLVMLIIYLVAMLYSGKDPYNDREFLLIFNALLVGVMAIIFFSIAGMSQTSERTPEIFILLLLSAVTIIVNGIALSAIVFRITEWGITPNRAAVLGANLLVLIHLLTVTVQLYKFTNKKAALSDVGNAIGNYLPIYFVWAIIVTFIFPFIFNFK